MSARRVRRDGLPAMVLFLLVPFGALFLGMAAHPAGLLDSEEEVRERTEGWRTRAAPFAAEAGVPLDLLLALVATESSGRPGAVSGSGAVGLTQLLPQTARGKAAELGHPDPASVDLFDPDENLRLGAQYLSEQLRTFGGDPALALAAYHAGPGAPMAWRRREPMRQGIDLVLGNASSATRGYVERVLDRRRWFAAGPPAPVAAPGAPAAR